jgi:cellulose synthase/poly-beta-1,6-N-acetylglucosamine synthase-like glycosyltransferase
LKKKGNGIGHARELALKECKTEFIASIDSDCVLDKDWVKRVIKHFENNKVVGVCGKLIEKYNKSFPDKWRVFHLNQHWGDEKMINPLFLFGSNSIYRVSALKNIGGYNPKYTTNFEDVDISTRLKKAGHLLVYDPSATCYHLKQDNLISVLTTARRWSFYSYEIPDSFINLLKRLLIYNPHYFLHSVIEDSKGFRLELVVITFFVFIYFQIYDVDYFLKHRKQRFKYLF